MTWLDDPDRVRVQHRLVWMNIAAVIVNLAVAVITHQWMSLANIIAAAFSANVAWRLYRKIPEITREQEQRILAILKGH